MKAKHLIISILVIILDQISKQYILRNFTLHESVKIFEGFNFTFITNPGIAFGIFAQNKNGLLSLFLVAVMIASIFFIVVLFKNLTDRSHMGKLSLSLILGGAIGNLIDRLIHKEVIDFLDVYYKEYHWPAFNVADAAISIGMFLFAYHLLIENKNIHTAKSIGKENQNVSHLS